MWGIAMKALLLSVGIVVALASAPVLAQPLAAQEWKQIPSTFTNSEGFRITAFTARVTGSGCEGSQRYVKINDPNRKGVSVRRWTAATKKDGGTVCTGGTWYYGGTNQPGGKEPDLLIKDGKFYRRG
jgi:hypothetical protein